MKFLTYLLIISSVLVLCKIANATDSDSQELADLVESNENDDDEELIEKREALDFFKRTLFHPGKSKNEEIKREVKEVYEEKCENVVPLASRHCPDLKTWPAFKAYENGE